MIPAVSLRPEFRSRYFVTQLFLRVVLYTVYLGTEQVQPAVRQISPETAWRHSYPVSPSYVSSATLWKLIYFCPVVTITPWFIYSRDWLDLQQAALSSSLSLLVNGLTTNCLKSVVGRPRPDFLARCHSHGRLRPEPCTGNPALVSDGRRSFPSGHSSFCSCLAAFASLFWAGKLGVFASPAAAVVPPPAPRPVSVQTAAPTSIPARRNRRSTIANAVRRASAWVKPLKRVIKRKKAVEPVSHSVAVLTAATLIATRNSGGNEEVFTWTSESENEPEPRQEEPGTPRRASATHADDKTPRVSLHATVEESTSIPSAAILHSCKSGSSTSVRQESHVTVLDASTDSTPRIKVTHSSSSSQHQTLDSSTSSTEQSDNSLQDKSDTGEDSPVPSSDSSAAEPPPAVTVSDASCQVSLASTESLQAASAAVASLVVPVADAARRASRATAAAARGTSQAAAVLAAAAQRSAPSAIAGSPATALALVAPLVAAAAVAVSRVCDYHHHWEDVTAGYIIGVVSAYAAYRCYYPSVTSPSPGTPRSTDERTVTFTW